MGIAFGVSWDDRKKGPARVILAALVALSLVSAAPPAREASAELVSVIVRELPGAGSGPERAVASAGGTIYRRIPIIDAFTARVPADAVGRLRESPGIHSVTPDRRVRLLHAVDGFDGEADPGSMFNLTKVIRSHALWRQGITGAGVDVALIDSGVAPVEGLTAPGKVVTGADLSFESQDENLRYVDTFGHGTHMAGIIAGRDGATGANDWSNHDGFMGVAPGSRIMSVKVANASGATDVSQVLAAIDWVVQHRHNNGMNIRVLNLSFGTDGVQDYRIDPLTYAVEVAWRHGIVVVVAAGNDGFGNAKLNNPAYDPCILAVGASDTLGTPGIGDDVIPTWSSRGDGTRNPDLVAPGKSVVSLRSPGSWADQHHPEGRVNARFFRGSGTSQAAAAVSGAVALLLQQRPDLTPDQVKALLTSTASSLKSGDPVAQGAGLVNLRDAAKAPTPQIAQNHPQATGTGSLEAARGSVHVNNGETELRGEMDIFGTAWDGQAWADDSWSRTSWSGGTWNGSEWTGDAWSRTSWSGAAWATTTWTRTSWSRTSWSRTSWSRTSWSRTSWSVDAWSSAGWGTG